MSYQGIFEGLAFQKVFFGSSVSDKIDRRINGPFHLRFLDFHTDEKIIILKVA